MQSSFGSQIACPSHGLAGYYLGRGQGKALARAGDVQTSHAHWPGTPGRGTRCNAGKNLRAVVTVGGKPMAKNPLKRLKTRLFFSLLTGVLALLLLLPTAQAMRLQLRARTLLHLQASQRPSQVFVHGQLSDARGLPAPGQAVALNLVAAAHRGIMPHVDALATTGADGRFEVAVDTERLGDQAQLLHVEAHFAGSPTLGGADAELTTDLHKLDTSLELRLESTRIGSDALSLGLEMDAMSGDVPVSQAEVQISVDSRQVLTARTPSDGRLAVRIPNADLGGPGSHVITAVLQGTELLNPCNSLQRFEMKGVVAVTLAIVAGQAGKPCASDDFCVSGSVHALAGSTQKPIAQAAVSLHVERHDLGTVPSDALGNFAVIVHSSALRHWFRPGALGLVARAQVPMPHYEFGLSPIVDLELQPPASLSGWIYGAAMLGLLGFVLLLRYRARRRERALLQQREADLAGLPTHALIPADQGLASCDVRGTVLHGETGRPTAARLQFWPMNGELHEIMSEDGGFSALALSPGQWRLQVHCEEHEILELMLQLPHDGQLDGCQLLPASCRAVVRGSFGASVRKFTGESMDWQVQTPREIEPRWSANLRRGQAELRDAVRKVERALYGARTPQDVAGQAKQALRRVEEVQK